MLAALSIRDIVLIDRLDLTFGPGLSVMTGETGAGKSILLDSFALALGGRGDSGLVRPGADKGQVTAAFELAPDHPVFSLLEENGEDAEGSLILRRVQSRAGSTKAFVNDAPVSVQLLRRIGSMLAEIHGQHDDRALTDPGTHRSLLDAFGGLTPQADAVRIAHGAWQDAEAALATHLAEIASARENADYLRHALEELEALQPEPDEEERLAEGRQIMMHAERISSELQTVRTALAGDGAARRKLDAAMRKLNRELPNAPNLIEPVVAAVERVIDESGEAMNIIDAALRGSTFEPSALEEAEERLFALRAAARKHQVQVSDLPKLMTRIDEELQTIDHGEERVIALRAAVDKERDAYERAATTLSQSRRETADRLDKAVTIELRPLKLEKAKFVTKVDSVDPKDGGPTGLDQVAFWVRTNPGTEPGPLMKIASGGELARFMLALKVVLTARGSAPTLIFDEIDTGVGGATAAAIGERLARLGDALQVLAVTHAPQVAAQAVNHLRIAKEAVGSGKSEAVATRVTILDESARLEEVARMLAGLTVTDEARAAADRLIRGAA